MDFIDNFLTQTTHVYISSVLNSILNSFLVFNTTLTPLSLNFYLYLYASSYVFSFFFLRTSRHKHAYVDQTLVTLTNFEPQETFDSEGLFTNTAGVIPVPGRVFSYVFS